MPHPCSLTPARPPRVQMLSLCLANQQPLRTAPVGSMLPGGRAALGVLIVCPYMLVKQWEQEITTKVDKPYGRSDQSQQWRQ